MKAIELGTISTILWL